MKASDKAIRVLLVDDEQDLLESTARALRPRGFAPATADNGLRALEWLENHPADVVVLDMKMPGIDGEQVFYEIQRRWPQLPVVILTGHGTVQQAFKTSRDGVFDYLPKPCEVEELAELLRRAARRAGPNRRSREPGPIRLLLVQAPSAGPVETPGDLSRWNLTVTECHSAGKAQQVLRQRQFDVVLLDVTWLGIRGFGLQQALARQSPPPAVIALTSRRTIGRAVEMLRNGASDLLVRPIGVGTLASRIREAHSRRTVRSLADQERQIQAVIDAYPD